MLALAFATLFAAIGLASALVLFDCWLKARAIIAELALAQPRAALRPELAQARLRPQPRRQIMATARSSQPRGCDLRPQRGAA